MTTATSSRTPVSNPFVAAIAPSLADVLARLDTADGLVDRARADMRSAVRTFCRLIDCQPEEVPAHPNFLRERLKRVAPARFGMSKGRWSNIRSLIGKALKVCGYAVMPGRYMAPLTPEWENFYRRLNSKTLECGLTRFLHYCSAQGIQPDDVREENFERFRMALENESLVKNHLVVHQHACRCWNKAVNLVDGWPNLQVKVPSYRESYTLDWSAFPSTLKDDTQRWLDRLAGRNLRKPIPFKPVKASTLECREFQIRQLASALVHRGHPAASIRTLADLVDVETAYDALRFFVDRAKGKTTTQIGGLATVIKAIGEHWVKVDEDHLDELKAIRRSLDPGRGGMTDKTRAMLRQFEDDGLIAAFLGLPDTLYRRARSEGPSFRKAVAVQITLAIELLTVAPMRISNLVSLDLDDNVIRIGQGKTQSVHLFVPASDVKNDIDLEFPLPNATVKLLDTYITDYRPLLLREQARWLFPGLGTNHKNQQTLGMQISSTIETELGLRITAHQFRHLSGYLYLRANPGGYEVVRALLGHKSIETTIRFYAGMEEIAAVREYARVLEQYRGGVTNEIRDQRNRS